jgi:hypothetical protein
MYFTGKKSMFNNDKENIKKKILAMPSVARRFVTIFTSPNRIVYASPLKRLGVPFA